MNKRLPEDISFGEWVRQRRHILDLTQQELADQVGCARITVRRIESGALKPSKALAQILLEKLGAPSTQGEVWLGFARGVSGFPGLSVDSSVSKPATNLPASLTSFIGREKEQEEAIRLITEHRLVTLAGVGGIGKTRLSQQIGQRLVKDYPHGVWFVALDSLSDPTLVPQTIAAVFDIREGPDRPLLERLIYALRAKNTLLILDNCEHVLDDCAQLIKTLLTNCSSLKILTTSREILNMDGEAIYDLQTLSLPEDRVSLEAIAEYEAIQLFTERAALTLSSFRLTNENAQTIVDICRRVDGIPLAIEMAATRVDILTVDEILRQLDHYFDLLVGKRRSTVPRHQTMRACMDWSWGLLTETEQKFMRQLSIFAGGWTLDSAQAVCERDVLDLLSALVKKSLIRVKQEAGGETRYLFHEIVRQYAYEKLVESREEEDIRTRHLKYFLGLSEQAEPALNGHAQIEWMERLNDEHDNVRAALDWSNKTNVEAGLYISGRLWRFWEDVDLREGERWLNKFLDTPDSFAYPHARAKALYTYGIVLYLTEQISSMKKITEECLTLYRTLGDQRGEIDALIVSGRFQFVSDNYTRARELAEQALALSEMLGDTWRKAFVLAHLGWAITDSFAQRAAYWKKAITLFRKLGDLSLLQDYLGMLGHMEVLEGELESAQRNVDEALQLNRSLKRKGPMGHILSALGYIEIIKGDFEKAQSLLEENLTIASELGQRMSFLWNNILLGHIMVQQGKISKAQSILFETTREFLKVGSDIGVAASFHYMAGLYIAMDKPDVAACLIGSADATREKINSIRPPFDQEELDKMIATCLEKIGEVAFSDAYEEGQRMSLDEAVAYALNES